MRVASASQTTPEVLACEDGDGREKDDAYEWCKSELPGCDRQTSTTAILNNGMPPRD
jgi:hypothetical protein